MYTKVQFQSKQYKVAQFVQGKVEMVHNFHGQLRRFYKSLEWVVSAHPCNDEVPPGHLPSIR